MKQVLQNLKTGVVEVADVPCPLVRPGHLLIQTRTSLISAGTERMLVEFGKASLLAKAKAQPEKVRQVLDKIKAEGLLATLETVFARLDEPLPLGYCNAGVVIGVGDGVRGFRVGDRVVSNGPHAEIVCVPRNLCARIPEGVSDGEAAYTVLASIGLQGVRLLEPTLGETIAVTGLGLIGLLTVQLLLANGCRVIGIDPDPVRLEIARGLGAEIVDLSAGADPVEAAMAHSDGCGVDGVIIAASAKTNDIVKQAAQMCRKRGRIVLVGVVGLELNRSDFYKKELSFQVSCSYGPGRYDPAYEDQGHDYPLAYVRWTQQRNFEAILALLAAKKLSVGALTSREVEHARATEAYQALTNEKALLGIVLKYPAVLSEPATTVALPPSDRVPRRESRAVVGVIGAGNFAKMYGLPSLAASTGRLACLADINGVAATHAGRKFGFENTTTDYRVIMNDPAINTVVIFTRHDMHAPLVMEALRAGKHVFVEKPLCLVPEQVDEICELAAAHKTQHLVVGFNRRFSPHGLKLKGLLAGRTEPLTMSMMVNAGVAGPDSWVHDPKVGGGRIVGEGCHWIDLMAFLANAPVVKVFSAMVGESKGLAVRDDKTSISLEFADGSIGTLHYFGNGHKAYPKETLEVFCAGKTLRLDNFRALWGYGFRGFTKMKLRRWDKGHREEFCRFIDSIVNGSASIISLQEIVNVMRATFAAVASARSGEPIVIE